MELAETFSFYFLSKIEAIHKIFQNKSTAPDLPEGRVDALLLARLSEFMNVSQDDVDNTLKQANVSLCLLDSVLA